LAVEFRSSSWEAVKIEPEEFSLLETVARERLVKKK
jgi:hypothetical protein